MALNDFNSLGARDRRPEIMDQPGLDPSLHRGALRALGRINRISGTAGRLWPEIERLSGRLGGRKLRVLDVACGGGDVAIAIDQLAARRGVSLEVTGCDLSSEALAYARAGALREGAGVSFLEGDVFGDPLPSCDAIVSSLFLHHLETGGAVELLRRMAATARHLVLLSDLLRSRLGRAYAYLASRLLTRSPIVRNDAMLSVAAAFTASEARELALRAALDDAEIHTHFPQRFLLVWRRQ